LGFGFGFWISTQTQTQTQNPPKKKQMPKPKPKLKNPKKPNAKTQKPPKNKLQTQLKPNNPKKQTPNPNPKETQTKSSEQTFRNKHNLTSPCCRQHLSKVFFFVTLKARCKRNWTRMTSTCPRTMRTRTRPHPPPKRAPPTRSDEDGSVGPLEKRLVDKEIFIWKRKKKIFFFSLNSVFSGVCQILFSWGSNLKGLCYALWHN